MKPPPLLFMNFIEKTKRTNIDSKTVSIVK